MVKFCKNCIFGIGLSNEDIKALRAGCSIKLPIEETEVELVLFHREEDIDMMAFSIAIGEKPEKIDTERMWL